jgi:hypothetical protein
MDTVFKVIQNPPMRSINFNWIEQCVLWEITSSRKIEDNLFDIWMNTNGQWLEFPSTRLKHYASRV